MHIMLLSCLFLNIQHGGDLIKGAKHREPLTYYEYARSHARALGHLRNRLERLERLHDRMPDKYADKLKEVKDAYKQQLFTSLSIMLDFEKCVEKARATFNNPYTVEIVRSYLFDNLSAEQTAARYYICERTLFNYLAVLAPYFKDMDMTKEVIDNG